MSGKAIQSGWLGAARLQRQVGKQPVSPVHDDLRLHLLGPLCLDSSDTERFRRVFLLELRLKNGMRNRRWNQDDKIVTLLGRKIISNPADIYRNTEGGLAFVLGKLTCLMHAAIRSCARLWLTLHAHQNDFFAFREVFDINARLFSRHCASCSEFVQHVLWFALFIALCNGLGRRCVGFLDSCAYCIDCSCLLMPCSLSVVDNVVTSRL